MQRIKVAPSLENPLAPPETVDSSFPGEIAGKAGAYEEVMKDGHDLIERPAGSVDVSKIEKQHFKNRMTVWERINILTQSEPNIYFQNWGKNLDGASLVTEF